MPESAGTIDRVAPTLPPNDRPIGFQRWRDLLFVHWRVSVFDIEPLIPKQLTLDTYDGSAWIGLVAFRMSGVRPWWCIPVPGISAFCETNVRTYVHREGRDPGVWFFSLDASSSLAVRLARWKWRLPYFRSAMQLRRSGTRVRYFSERLWPGTVGTGGTLQAEYGDLIGTLDKTLAAGQSAVGTLEHFLAERYILYSQSARRQLYCGRVHHRPYALREATLTKLDITLLSAAGVNIRSAPSHVMFSDGLDVNVHRLRPVDAG